MTELKPCPFCGGGAEMYTGRTFPVLNKSFCKTEADAMEYLEECRSNGVVVDFKIGNRTRSAFNRNTGHYGETKHYYSVYVHLQAYIPRCLNPKCLGRTQMMFRTETEAIEAWNRRMET